MNKKTPLLTPGKRLYKKANVNHSDNDLCTIFTCCNNVNLEYLLKQELYYNVLGAQK